MHQSALRLARSMARWCRDPSTIYAACKNEYSAGIPSRARIEAMIAENAPASNDDEPDEGWGDGVPWHPRGLVVEPKPVRIKAARRSRAKPKRNRDYIFVPQIGHNPFMRRPGRAMSVVASVGRSFGFSLDEMIGAGRNRQHAKARFICYRLLRDIGLSTPHIGRIMDRDHTTVVHGLQRFEQELVRDKGFADIYNRHVVLAKEAAEGIAA